MHKRLYLYFFVFFFKQKTAYEMRISDWSSDVCSSDLVGGLLQDVTRPGRPRSAREAAKVEEVVRITLEQRPSGATHWSTRTLAAHLGTNATAVARIWRAHGLKPHRVKTFKLSNDPHFIEKLERSDEHTSELQSLMRIS